MTKQSFFDALAELSNQQYSNPNFITLTLDEVSLAQAYEDMRSQQRTAEPVFDATFKCTSDPRAEILDVLSTSEDGYRLTLQFIDGTISLEDLKDQLRSTMRLDVDVIILVNPPSEVSEELTTYLHQAKNTGHLVIAIQTGDTE